MAPPRRSESTSSESNLDDDDEHIEKRPKLAKPKVHQRNSKFARRFTGGLVVSSEADKGDNSASTSLSAVEKKGLKEVEELERELDLKNTFSRETNKRDEDAEMNKYIEEEIRKKREASEREQQRLDDNQSDVRGLEDATLLQINSVDVASDKIDDILLHTLSRRLAPDSDEKSEAMLSSQMLNGIPEVDLGIHEKIRTIEATEEAKHRIPSSKYSRRSHKKPPGAWSRF